VCVCVKSKFKVLVTPLSLLLLLFLNLHGRKLCASTPCFVFVFSSFSALSRVYIYMCVCGSSKANVKTANRQACFFFSQKKKNNQR
jgi:hypothetical protein